MPKRLPYVPAGVLHLLRRRSQLMVHCTCRLSPAADRGSAGKCHPLVPFLSDILSAEWGIFSIHWSSDSLKWENGSELFRLAIGYKSLAPTLPPSLSGRSLSSSSFIQFIPQSLVVCIGGACNKWQMGEMLVPILSTLAYR